MSTCSIQDLLSTAVEGWVAGASDSEVARRMKGAVMESLTTLLEYASAPLGERDAVDEERSASEAARAAVRPLFEARLQERLDALDGEMAGQCECPSCGCSMESQEAHMEELAWRGVGASPLFAL